MRVVKVTPFLRWEGGERGEKIVGEIERENRFLGGVVEGEEGDSAFCISYLESADFSMD